MTYVIPANCQVKAGHHTITFSREMRVNDPICAHDVIEIDGYAAVVGREMPIAIMREVSAMVSGVPLDAVVWGL